MFFPNEIITEILDYLAYQTWIDKINKINKQYHSLFKYRENREIFDKIGGLYYNAIYCKQHSLFVVQWRNNGYYNNSLTEKYIHPICVNFKQHKPKNTAIRRIKLPHNY